MKERKFTIVEEVPAGQRQMREAFGSRTPESFCSASLWEEVDLVRSGIAP